MRTLTEQEAISEPITGSLKGYVYASYSELVEILGEPTFNSGEGYRITFEWVVIYKGAMYSVYDWKVYANESMASPNFKWNVGSDKSASKFINKLWLEIELNRKKKAEAEETDQ